MTTRRIILRDIPETHVNLLPLTYTRPVADLLVGINTIRQKWEMYLPGEYHYQTEEYLREKYPSTQPGPGDIVVTSSVVPEEQLAKAVGELKPGQTLTATTARGQEVTVATCVGDGEVTAPLRYDSKVDTVEFLYDIFQLNARKIEDDFEFLTRGREGQSIPRSNTD